MYGLASVEDLPGTMFGTIHCNRLVNWLVNPECWDRSPEAWEQVLAFGRPDSSLVKPPVAPPETFGTVAAPFDCAANPASDPSCPGYDAATAAAIAAGKAQTDEGMRQFFEEQGEVRGSDSQGLSWILWLAGGLAVAGIFLGGRR